LNLKSKQTQNGLFERYINAFLRVFRIFLLFLASSLLTGDLKAQEIIKSDSPIYKAFIQYSKDSKTKEVTKLKKFFTEKLKLVASQVDKLEKDPKHFDIKLNIKPIQNDGQKEEYLLVDIGYYYFSSGYSQEKWVAFLCEMNQEKIEVIKFREGIDWSAVFKPIGFFNIGEKEIFALEMKFSDGGDGDCFEKIVQRIYLVKSKKGYKTVGTIKISDFVICDEGDWPTQTDGELKTSNDNKRLEVQFVVKGLKRVNRNDFKVVSTHKGKKEIWLWDGEKYEEQ